MDPKVTLTPSTTPSTSTPDAVPASATAMQADVVLGVGQNNQTIIVHVGQILNIPNDFGFEWNISFNPDILQALTPTERSRQPGPEGWFFKAIAPGKTTILLTSIPPRCPAGSPCPPNVIRLVFPIQAQP